jgi:WXG100 family type VII secretion target
MTTTEAQAAVMFSTAARFDQARESLDSTLSRLMIELDALRTQWQGAGGRSFDAVRVRWADDLAKLTNALGATADSIRRAASRYDASDEQAAARFSGPGPLTLPL